MLDFIKNLGEDKSIQLNNETFIYGWSRTNRNVFIGAGKVNGFNCSKNFIDYEFDGYLNGRWWGPKK